MSEDKLTKILVGIIGVLALVILVGTIFGISHKKQQKPEVLIAKGKAENLAKPADTSVVAYYDLEKIRIITAPEKDFGTPMVLDPWLAYPEGDTIFYEELARKRGLIKGIFTSYFSSHTKTELLTTTEQNIVQELLSQINAELSLGQVLDIYFTDYLFLE